MRAFWTSRTKRYCNIHGLDTESWSARNILSSVTARSVPLGMAKRYFVFASCVSLAFENIKAMDPSDWLLHDLIVYMTSHQEALTKPVGFVATALFLMASFRLNRAATRWWQARFLFGDFHADVRSFVSPPPSLLRCRLSPQSESVAFRRLRPRDTRPIVVQVQNAHLYVTDVQTATELSLLVSAFPRMTEMKLRQNDDDDYRRAFGELMGDKIEHLIAAPNRSAYIALQTNFLMKDAINSGHIRGIPRALPALITMQKNIERLNKTQEAIALLQSMPEPWRYQKHMRFTVAIWLTLLPVALVRMIACNLLWRSRTLITSTHGSSLCDASFWQLGRCLRCISTLP